MADLLFTTYTELKASIAEELNRTDLTSQIPGFIALLEAELDRHPAVQFEFSNVALTVQANPTVLPDDCRELRSARYDDGVRFGPVDIVPPDRLPLYRQQFGLTGYPRALAVTGNGLQVEVAPVPDQAYVIRIGYLTKLTKLSATEATNWLLDEHPDLYFYGALKHSAPFLKDDPRVATWESFYQVGLAQLNALVERRRYGSDTLVMRPKRAIG